MSFRLAGNARWLLNLLEERHSIRCCDLDVDVRRQRSENCMSFGAG